MALASSGQRVKPIGLVRTMLLSCLRATVVTCKLAAVNTNWLKVWAITGTFRQQLQVAGSSRVEVQEPCWWPKLSYFNGKELCCLRIGTEGGKVVKVSLTLPASCLGDCKRQEQISSMTALLSGNFLSEGSSLIIHCEDKRKAASRGRYDPGKPELFLVSNEMQWRALVQTRARDQSRG